MEIHRQPFLQEELKKRIMAGKRGDLLPTAAELAAEYGVNIKTVNKVLNQLAASGLLERKRRTGTVILGNIGKMYRVSGLSKSYFPDSSILFCIRSGVNCSKGSTRCSPIPATG